MSEHSPSVCGLFHEVFEVKSLDRPRWVEDGLEVPHDERAQSFGVVGRGVAVVSWPRQEQRLCPSYENREPN